MGYPVITRLGLNQFWYKHWYSDVSTNYFLNFKQDLMFTQLFKTYLNYGLSFRSSLFFHEFFFSKNYKEIRLRLLFKNLKYFRRFYFSHDKLGIEHSYFLRYRTGEYFPLRLWVLKYSNWVLLCFSCFKPIKKKLKKLKKLKDESYALSVNLQFSRSNIKYNRYKLIFLFFKSFAFFKNNKYSF